MPENFHVKEIDIHYLGISEKWRYFCRIEIDGKEIVVKSRQQYRSSSVALIALTQRMEVIKRKLVKS